MAMVTMNMSGLSYQDMLMASMCWMEEWCSLRDLRTARNAGRPDKSGHRMASGVCSGVKGAGGQKFRRHLYCLGA